MINSVGNYDNRSFFFLINLWNYKYSTTYTYIYIYITYTLYNIHLPLSTRFFYMSNYYNCVHFALCYITRILSWIIPATPVILHTDWGKIRHVHNYVKCSLYRYLRSTYKIVLITFTIKLGGNNENQIMNYYVGLPFLK
jgi:hypothetical protein